MTCQFELRDVIIPHFKPGQASAVRISSSGLYDPFISQVNVVSFLHHTIVSSACLYTRWRLHVARLYVCLGLPLLAGAPGNSLLFVYFFGRSS